MFPFGDFNHNFKKFKNYVFFMGTTPKFSFFICHIPKIHVTHTSKHLNLFHFNTSKIPGHTSSRKLSQPFLLTELQGVFIVDDLRGGVPVVSVSCSGDGTNTESSESDINIRLNEFPPRMYVLLSFSLT